MSRIPDDRTGKIHVFRQSRTDRVKEKDDREKKQADEEGWYYAKNNPSDDFFNSYRGAPLPHQHFFTRSSRRYLPPGTSCYNE
jgi:hypothetical protein